VGVKRLRLLLVIPGIDSGGGAEQSLLELVPELIDTGIEVSVVYMEVRPTGNEGQLERIGAGLDLVADRRLDGRVRGVRRVIASRRPDIVHTMLFEADLAGRLAAWRAPGCSPIVLSSIVNTSYDPVRFADPNVRPWKLQAVRMVDGWTARNLTDHFHAISCAAKNAAVESLDIDPNRVTVVERGRDRSRLGDPSPERRARARARLGLSQDARVIVTVGRQEFQKGHGYLVRAFDRLARTRPDAELLLVGRRGRKSEEIDAQMASSRYHDRIRALGHRDDVPDLLAAADVFALPSLYEGFGCAAIEAMALGLPVVASNLPVMHEVVEDGGSGLLVQPGNVEAFAAAIGQLLDNPEARRRFGDWGRQLFLEQFTAERSHRRMIELYKRLVTA
jgi:glycosyltransferase involved in cell wall biosynthesis